MKFENPEILGKKVQMITPLNTTVAIGSNEDLRSLAEDESFDVYLACLSLQIVPEPIKMLNEAFRVLKKGGKAAMSIWGQ